MILNNKYNIDYDRTKSYEDMSFYEKFIDWNTFFKKNIHRFVEYYLELEMHLYQQILLYLMNLCPLVVVVACRASAKSFIIAVFACAKAILQPKSLIVIASATKKQASLIVSEKIKKELMPKSPNLRREIIDIRAGANETEVIFRNGSSIVVVPATDNARGYRATCMIYEEFRMIKKDIIDFVLSPFLIIRQAPFINKDEYGHLAEEPMEIYISSSYYASHWMSKMIHLAVTEMYNKSEALFIAFDYSITLKHKIRTFKQLRKEKKKMGTTAFAMEYENEMVGQGEDAFYPYELLEKAQTLKKAFYPRRAEDVIEKNKNKHDIPKQKNEIRILSVDIALMGGTKNDNTVIHCARCIPVKDYYERQVVYTESFNGVNSTEQAVRFKELFYDFNADYIVIDAQNAGTAIIDELGRVTYSDSRDIEYEPWVCFNNEELASRIKNTNAKPVIYAIKGYSAINEQLHVFMKDALNQGRFKMLVNEVKCKDYLETKKEYLSGNAEQKAELERPYLQSDLTVNEFVSLSSEINKNSNKLKLYETGSNTKDRYISCAYLNYFVKQLEIDLLEDVEDDPDDDLVYY